MQTKNLIRFRSQAELQNPRFPQQQPPPNADETMDSSLRSEPYAQRSKKLCVIAQTRNWSSTHVKEWQCRSGTSGSECTALCHKTVGGIGCFETMDEVTWEMLLQRLQCQWRTFYPSGTRKKKILCNYFPSYFLALSFSFLHFLSRRWPSLSLSLARSLSASVWLLSVKGVTARTRNSTENLKLQYCPGFPIISSLVLAPTLSKVYPCVCIFEKYFIIIWIVKRIICIL